MLLPNKIVRYEDSVIARFPVVLEALRRESAADVRSLFESCEAEFKSAGLFVQTLDCLFALGKIRFSGDSGEIALC